MSEQLGMFPPVVEAVSATITRDPFGWRLRVATRFEGERWHSVTWLEYEHLTMAELLEVIESSAAQNSSKIL